MALKKRSTLAGRVRSRGVRDLQEMDARGRITDTASPLTLGAAIFVSVVLIAALAFNAGQKADPGAVLILSVVVAIGVALAAGVALATSRFQAVKQFGDAQMELLAIHGELEYERTERRALLHDARAVVGAMGAALHALERSGEQANVHQAMAAQVNHLREVLATPVSNLRPTPLDHFREPLVAFANLHGMSVSVDLPAQVHVMAEPASVVTILQNLVDNARKYAPGSPVRVIWEPAGTHIRLCVEDRGPGLQGDVEALFGQSVRGSAGDEGWGLGLATARRLAEKNQGGLWYEQREGPGSRFVVRLLRASAGGPEEGTLWTKS